MPLVQELALDGVPVAAGESSVTPADVSFVADVRDLGAGGTVTVDDLDLSMGAAALVLGLDDLLATGRRRCVRRTRTARSRCRPCRDVASSPSWRPGTRRTGSPTPSRPCGRSRT